jgi:hypothetical protein
MKFPRCAKKMTISESTPLSYDDFLKYKPRAADMQKVKNNPEWPFTKDRFDAVEPVALSQFPQFHCEHMRTGNSVRQEAFLIADVIDGHWQLRWVLSILIRRIGLLCCGFHAGRCALAALEGRI